MLSWLFIFFIHVILFVAFWMTSLISYSNYYLIKGFFKYFIYLVERVDEGKRESTGARAEGKGVGEADSPAHEGA